MTFHDDIQMNALIPIVVEQTNRGDVPTIFTPGCLRADYLLNGAGK